MTEDKKASGQGAAWRELVAWDWKEAIARDVLRVVPPEMLEQHRKAVALQRAAGYEDDEVEEGLTVWACIDGVHNSTLTGYSDDFAVITDLPPDASGDVCDMCAGWVGQVIDAGPDGVELIVGFRVGPGHAEGDDNHWYEGDWVRPDDIAQSVRGLLAAGLTLNETGVKDVRVFFSDWVGDPPV